MVWESSENITRISWNDMDFKIKNIGIIPTLDQKPRQTCFSVNPTVILWLLFIEMKYIAKNYFIAALLRITFFFYSFDWFYSAERKRYDSEILKFQVLEGLFLSREHNYCRTHSVEVKHKELPVVKTQKYKVIKACYSLGHCSVKETNQRLWIRCL